MTQEDILTDLFDKKILQTLRLFYKNPTQKYYLREISRLTEVPPATTFRLIEKLTNLKLLDIHRLKKFKLYQLADNEGSRFLGQLIKREKQALEIFITKAKLMDGLQKIILKGQEQKDKADIILIAQELNQSHLKQICSELKEEFNYNVIPLVLAHDQFEQMDAMNLIPGRKKVLFEK